MGSTTARGYASIRDLLALLGSTFDANFDRFVGGAALSLSTNAVDREREGLVARATQSLREALLHGSFRPGAKLTLREVARELGTSVTPVREAVAKLVADGALEARAGYSARVPILSAERYEELLRIRIRARGICGQRRFGAVSETGHPRARQSPGHAEEGSESYSWQEYLRLSKEFRFAVYERSGMTMLVELIERLWLQAAPVFFPSISAVSRRSGPRAGVRGVAGRAGARGWTRGGRGDPKGHPAGEHRPVAARHADQARTSPSRASGPGDQTRCQDGAKRSVLIYGERICQFVISFASPVEAGRLFRLVGWPHA